jgi:hypothetical protein
LTEYIMAPKRWRKKGSQNRDEEQKHPAHFLNETKSCLTYTLKKITHLKNLVRADCCFLVIEQLQICNSLNTLINHG